MLILGLNMLILILQLLDLFFWPFGGAYRRKYVIHRKQEGEIALVIFVLYYQQQSFLKKEIRF